MMQDRTIPLEKFPEKVRRFVDPAAPAPLKLMLARGLVPVQPLVQVCALCHLAAIGEPELTAASLESVRKLPIGTIRQIASEPLLPVVLDWLAEVFFASREVLAAILLNRLTDDETLIWLAERGDEDLCERFAHNQARLLATPKLVEVLYFNRNLRASTADRMIDFAARNGVDLSAIPCADEVVAAVQSEVSSRTSADDQAVDEAFARAQAAIDDLAAELGDDELKLEELLDSADDVAQAEEEGAGHSAAGRIRNLNVAQRVRLALLGNAAERAILIRDGNKVVARAAIRSPGVGDSEVLMYAKNRALMDEIITFIAQNKRWTRNYQVKLALVNNPKTPVAQAMVFLKYLRSNDLRILARSHNIPGPVSKAAKQMAKDRNE